MFVFLSKYLACAVGARIFTKYRYGFLLNTILDWVSINHGSGMKIREFETDWETYHLIYDIVQTYSFIAKPTYDTKGYVICSL